MEDCDGRIYAYDYGVYVRVTGTPIASATIHQTEKLRCNLCLTIFEALEGESLKNTPKYDHKFLANLILVKYGLAVPFHRLETYQLALGIPLPSSTQAELVKNNFDVFLLIFGELEKLAASFPLIGMDDTYVKILEFIKENKKNADDKGFRRGMFTSVFVAIEGAIQVVLYYSGRQHAGENLETLLAKRDPELPPPIVSSDALTCYKSYKKDVIDDLCMSHARRKFHEIEDFFPQLCEQALKFIEEIYINDDHCKDEAFSTTERMNYHQENSMEPLNNLMDLLSETLEEKKVEPNDDAGKACSYFLKHWNEITTFMRVPRAPLDTNFVEREIKNEVQIRKNSYFFKTQNGARMADVLLSIISTCRLNRINIFDYLVWVLDNREQVKGSPEDFVPGRFTRLSSMAA